MLRVLVHAGHNLGNTSVGVYDSGAVADFCNPDGTSFRAEEAAIAAKIAEDLAKACEGASPAVLQTPKCNADCPNRHPRKLNPPGPASHLSYVVSWINSHNKPFDYVISLHLNSGPEAATGVEVYYANGASKTRQKQAKAALKALSDVLGLPARGVFPSGGSQHSSLAILDKTEPPALLFELGFVTNKDDVHAVSTKGVMAIIEAIKAIKAVD